MSAPWSVGILGAGRMAQAFDAPGPGPVQSLAHAVTRTPSFSLGGFFDVDTDRAAEAERRWGCGPSARDRATWLAAGWDAIFIATPDDRHAEDLADALAARPRAILVEKPVSPDAVRGERLLAEALRLEIPVIVDYPRRWHTGVAAVSELLANGTLGAPERAIFAYSGGMAHSAVHMIDLLHTWAGGGWSVKDAARAPSGARVTLTRDGAELDIVFVEQRPETYYLWEVHLYCGRGKVELSRSPEVLSIWRPAVHPGYPTHAVLGEHARYDMESEPLLERTLEQLARTIADPADARRQLRREIDSQAFVATVLGAAR